MISLTLDNEDVDLIVTGLNVGVHAMRRDIEKAHQEGWTALALQMQHELDQIEAVLEQLENME
jgi:peptide deformylase